MSITMSCNRCGASITSSSVAEAVAWDESHDTVCPNFEPKGDEQ